MNRWIKFGLLAVLSVAVVLVGVGVADAQGENPPVEPLAAPWGPHHGRGPGNGVGLMAEYQGLMHEAIAEALGISVEEFESAIDSGETLITLAEAEGVELEELRTAMNEARDEALEQALADGISTKEQAEWMQQGPGAHGPRGPMLEDCDGQGPMRDGSGSFAPRGGRFGGRS